MLKRVSALLLGLAILTTSGIVNAAGGSGGGGGGSGGGGGGSGGITTNARISGYITAIDYVNFRVTVGQSYYGSGVLTGTSDTKVSIDNVNATFNDIQVGDFAEVRYDFASRLIGKIAVTR